MDKTRRDGRAELGEEPPRGTGAVSLLRQAACHLIVMGRLPQYFRKLQRILVRRGRTREEAEDLIQQAFLKLQEYCDRGGEVRQPEGFLIRTVLRLAINARRDEHRHLYVDTQVEELTHLVDSHPTPDEVLAHD